MSQPTSRVPESDSESSKQRWLLLVLLLLIGLIILCLSDCEEPVSAPAVDEAGAGGSAGAGAGVGAGGGAGAGAESQGVGAGEDGGERAAMSGGGGGDDGGSAGAMGGGGGDGVEAEPEPLGMGAGESGGDLPAMSGGGGGGGEQPSAEMGGGGDLDAGGDAGGVQRLGGDGELPLDGALELGDGSMPSGGLMRGSGAGAGSLPSGVIETALGLDLPLEGGPGTPLWRPGSLGGNVYFVDGITDLPDLSGLTPLGTLFLERVDLAQGPAPLRIGARQQNFVLDYTGTLHLDAPKTLYFRLSSDDGSRLSIDGQAVIDIRGGGRVQVRRGTVALAAGAHDFRLAYYQAMGPTHLVLEVSTDPEEAYAIFDTRDFLAPSSGEVAQGHRITVESEMIFFPGSYGMTPGASDALAPVLAAARRPASGRVIVEGHATGEDALALSRLQAKAVARWLHAQGVAAERLGAVGVGDALFSTPNSVSVVFVP